MESKLYKNPMAVKKHHVLLQRCQLHTTETFNISLGYFCFVEFNILISIMICRQRRAHTNPGPAPLYSQHHSHRTSQPQGGKKATQLLGHALDHLKTRKKRCYSNLLANLIHTDIPGYQNFVRMAPAFLPH